MTPPLKEAWSIILPGTRINGGPGIMVEQRHNSLGLTHIGIYFETRFPKGDKRNEHRGYPQELHHEACVLPDGTELWPARTTPYPGQHDLYFRFFFDDETARLKTETLLDGIPHKSPYETYLDVPFTDIGPALTSMGFNDVSIQRMIGMACGYRLALYDAKGRIEHTHSPGFPLFIKEP